MMRILFVSCLVATVMAQGGKPRPTWYVDDLNTDKLQCERYRPGQGKETNGPIYVDVSAAGQAPGKTSGGPRGSPRPWS